MLPVMSRRVAVRQSVQRYRDRMRSAGFRLVQLWVADTRASGFADECRRQSLVAAAREGLEAGVLGWIDAGRDDEGWTA